MAGEAGLSRGPETLTSGSPIAHSLVAFTPKPAHDWATGSWESQLRKVTPELCFNHNFLWLKLPELFRRWNLCGKTTRPLSLSKLGDPREL